MAMDTVGPPTSGSTPLARRGLQRYLREARRPWHCLLLLVPGVVLYEVGVWLEAGDGAARELLAHSVIHELFGWFGFVGFWVPAVVLIATLLVWHRLARDRYRTRWWVLPAMMGESVLLAVPLLVMSGLFSPAAQDVFGAGLRAQLVAALGAGIYEELIFRLLLISALRWLLKEGLQLAVDWRATLVAAVGAALLFSLCHFEPIGSDPLVWRTFWFKLVAGLYLSAVFVGRGLGVSSGAHVAYNVLLVLLRIPATVG